MIIRKAQEGDAAGIARVHVQSWQETYRGMMPDNVLDNLSVEQRQTFWHKAIVEEIERHPLFVAEDEHGQIVGFVSGGEQQEAVEGYDGELYAIYLLQAAQGKGIGRDLIKRLASELHRMGYISMVLWMLAGNDTGGFYEHLGGTVVAEGTYPFRKQTLRKVAYGWPDIRTLLAE